MEQRRRMLGIVTPRGEEARVDLYLLGFPQKDLASVALALDFWSPELIGNKHVIS